MRTCVVFLLFFMLNEVSYSENEVFKTYQSVGTLQGIHLSRGSGTEPIGPSSFIVDSANIVTWDRTKKKVLVYSNTLQRKDSYSFEVPQINIPAELGFEILNSNKFYILDSEMRSIYLIDKVTKQLACDPIRPYLLIKESVSNLQILTMVDNFLVLEDVSKTQYFFIGIPEKLGEEVSYLNPGESKKYVDSLKKGESGLHFDTRGLLWNGNILLTKSSSSIDHVLQKNGIRAIGEQIPNGTILWGQDVDGNYYWGSFRTLFVVSKDFDKVTKLNLSFQKDEDLIGPVPAIAPNGDIYGLVLNFKNRGVDIKLIKRDW